MVDNPGPPFYGESQVSFVPPPPNIYPFLPIVKGEGVRSPLETPHKRVVPDCLPLQFYTYNLLNPSYFIL